MTVLLIRERGASSSGWIGVSRSIFVGQRLVQGVDGLFQGGQVLVDGGLQDGVCGVEVAVGKVVSHPGDPGLRLRLRATYCAP